MDDLNTLVEFKRLDSSDSMGIPVSPGARTVTDKKGFLIYAIGLVILLPLLIYTLRKSEPRHLTHYADSCGNFCGLNNTYFPEVICSGKDFSKAPYYTSLYGCSSYCLSNGTTRDGRCIDGNEVSRVLSRLGEVERYSFKVAVEEARRDWWKFPLTIILTIVLSILTLVVLRYATTPLVWAFIIFAVMILLVTAGSWWYAYAIQEPSNSFLLLMAAFWSIIVFIIITVILVVIKKIRLVIQLYKEAVKVLAAMPQLIIVPILATLVEFVILGIGYTTTFYLMFSQDLYPVPGEYQTYKYHLSPTTVFTIFLNVLIFVWSIRFIEGIQFMIISGSVSRWYFSKNKQYLDSPILTSTKITMRYHLGTVAFGSFLITIFAVFKATLKVIFRNVCCRCLVILYCSSVEIILKFISENSYIETALRGQSYYKSAKRATNLLLANAKSVVAVNCVGDFVLAIMTTVVIIIATAISFGIFMGPVVANTAFPTIICFVVNIIIVCITFATLQAIIDTLFICFCEDSVLNDGVTRPYFMSRGLMELVENSKKMYGKTEKR